MATTEVSGNNLTPPENSMALNSSICFAHKAGGQVSGSDVGWCISYLLLCNKLHELSGF
jgi:hypothetical protein